MGDSVWLKLLFVGTCWAACMGPDGCWSYFASKAEDGWKTTFDEFCGEKFLSKLRGGDPPVPGMPFGLCAMSVEEKAEKPPPKPPPSGPSKRCRSCLTSDWASL